VGSNPTLSDLALWPTRDCWLFPDLIHILIHKEKEGRQQRFSGVRGGLPAVSGTAVRLAVSHDPSELARFLVRRLPCLSQKIVVAPWGALHDELRLLTRLVVDGVVDGSEFRARLGDDYLIVSYFDV
jgi:hypothetical protein